MANALNGVRVVELSNFLAGPLAAMYLGDFGADVVKVEKPDGGDEGRLWGRAKDGVGLYFKVVNRNKRSVTADLRTPIGVEIVKRLTTNADVVIENYRPGTLERWGLGYEELSRDNPGLIMLRVSGFGQTGPYRHRPGFGTLAEAFSGYAYITGFPDREPLLPAFGLADETTGLHGAFLTMVALKAREVTGQGQEIDLAIYESLYTLLGPQVVEYDQLGVVQERDGSRLAFTAPRNIYRTRDGQYVSISGSGQRTFERICAALGRPDLPHDPRFRDNRTRIEHVEALDAELQALVGTHDRADLLDLFDRHQATVAPVYSVADTFEDPHYVARENVVRLDDDQLGQVGMQGVVGRLSGTPGEIRSAGPSVGEHNEEVLLGELGFTMEELRTGGWQSEVKPLPSDLRTTPV